MAAISYRVTRKNCLPGELTELCKPPCVKLIPERVMAHQKSANYCRKNVLAVSAGGLVCRRPTNSFGRGEDAPVTIQTSQ